MTFRDSGGEYLAKMLADPETAVRVAGIREQMRLADSQSKAEAQESEAVTDTIGSAIRESLANTDYGKILADQGITTVALEGGRIVEYRPDGSIRDLDANEG